MTSSSHHRAPASIHRLQRLLPLGGLLVLLGVGCGDDAPAPPGDAGLDGGGLDGGGLDGGNGDGGNVDGGNVDGGGLDGGSVDGDGGSVDGGGGPDGGASDAGMPRAPYLYYVHGAAIARLPLDAAGASGPEETVTSVGTWVSALDFDDVGDRLYWADSTSNEIRSVARDGTGAALFASTASLGSNVDAIVVDDVARSVVFAGSSDSSLPAVRGPIARFPIAGGASVPVAYVGGINGIALDSGGRFFSVTDDGRCDVDMRMVRVDGDGSALRQGAIAPAVTCAGINVAAAVTASDGSATLYFTHKTDFATGSCISGARSCVERVSVTDGGAGALVVTARTSLADADTRGAVIGLAVDALRGHLYIARGALGGGGTSFVLVRTDLAGAAETPIASFTVATGGSTYTSFGLPMRVAP